jgi:hypothetical protein
MWGEGASDLGGRLQESEDERDDAELVAAIRARLSQTVQSPEMERGSASWGRDPLYLWSLEGAKGLRSSVEANGN